jgi:hypothetical protein
VGGEWRVRRPGPSETFTDTSALTSAAMFIPSSVRRMRFEMRLLHSTVPIASLGCDAVH